ncbi:hypothetical protein AT15_02965 [Kosmotoga arenicorallina S304]|uniref:N-acetyltransferase domain-containing protein n=1 Tax=Kosmotoga arenicorallina S304 TaxID=1453497 RepID=A0A176K3B7_9BACT|nr:GNAT family N-acetyltransferase [Kosmotoga arenicorallina]OAA31805.1 hypothetical protein AT15_02965 [Kosmotoga arenicorallina S304]
MIVRQAQPQDNEKLLEIERTSSQEGSIWFASERKDFFEKMNHFEDGFMLVAEDEESGDIIGCVGSGYADYWLEGRKQRGAYMYGLRTNPKYRMRVARWLKAVIQKMSDILENSDVEFGFGSVKADNINSVKILRHMKFEPARVLNFYTVPVVRKGNIKGINIDENPDPQVLQNYYDEKKNDYDLVPLDLGKNFFPKLIAEGKIKLAKYRTATAIIWDTLGEFDVKITRLPIGLRLFRDLAALVTKLFPFVRIPALNEPIHSWNVIFLDYENSKDGKYLLKAIHKLAWKENVMLLNFAEDSELSKIRSILGTLKFTLPFKIALIDRARSKKTLKPIIWPPRI